ncbi:integral membrane protein [Aspergillus terreus]|uniref:Integral membrane protein n=1 Tax=Aspergillus terreus TaxID=33178 RepID=A0A5M3ZEU0_ASPTE|nr:hypothetical protein ATETN484_0013024400 [Aspergillus terreus]GFF20478.1 integral membrane protein [Aspergillus terreus]
MTGPQTASEATGFIVSQPQKFVLTAFSGIALFIAIEVIILCFVTFKRYRGAYFWSLLVASCGLIVNCIGFIIFFFVAASPYVSVTLILIGWYCMVTGHSIVLWSRLHLVFRRPKYLRLILALIVTNAICLHVPITVLLYGAVTPTSPPSFERGYDIMERIQLIGFCLQEFLLSGIYIWQTSKLLRLRPQGAPYRVVLTRLLVINVVILALDATVVILEYAGLFSLQVFFKPLAYGLKLRLEYAILGSLIQLVTSGSYCGQIPSSEGVHDTSPLPS